MGLNAIERDEERKKYNNIITILDGYLLNAIQQLEKNKNDKTRYNLLKNCVIYFT